MITILSKTSSATYVKNRHQCIKTWNITNTLNIQIHVSNTYYIFSFHWDKIIIILLHWDRKKSLRIGNQFSIRWILFENTSIKLFSIQRNCPKVLEEEKLLKFRDGSQNVYWSLNSYLFHPMCGFPLKEQLSNNFFGGAGGPFMSFTHKRAVDSNTTIIPKAAALKHFFPTFWSKL